mmetsp:Transcript_18146/g.51467  ORF Transcript_18146/g.51467 Transcript_18146/m.51467 type:complete len:540 (+) Transcript_18146:95-1714(+)
MVSNSVPREEGGAEMLECDYLVIGAGASGLAFVDSLLERAQAATKAAVETGKKAKEKKDISIIVVDERDHPGGHWNDAYRFARLHHESSHYGVGSRKLEKVEKAGKGINKAKKEGKAGGHYASTGEVLVYYNNVIKDFIDTGCVRYFRMCSWREDTIVSTLDPSMKWTVCANCKIVDSSYLRIQAPSTRPPPFEVGLGAFVVPPSFLPSVSVPPAKYVIIGAGRTAIDAILWLLRMGVKSARVQWVMPRDHWYMCREALDGKQVMHTSITFTAVTMQNTSLEHAMRELERAGLFCRLDCEQIQECFHGAAVSQEELEKLRSIPDVIRLGRVRSIYEDYVMLERGQFPCVPGTLHVDCTSDAIRKLPDPVPIWQTKRILLQPVQEVLIGAGEFNIPCSAALLGFIEGLFPDDETKNSLCTSGRYPDTIQDWFSCHLTAAKNKKLWGNNAIVTWLTGHRLSLFSSLTVQEFRMIATKTAVDTRVNLEKILKDGASEKYRAKASPHAEETSSAQEEVAAAKEEAASAEELRSRAASAEVSAN